MKKEPSSKDFSFVLFLIGIVLFQSCTTTMSVIANSVSIASVSKNSTIAVRPSSGDVASLKTGKMIVSHLLALGYSNSEKQPDYVLLFGIGVNPKGYVDSALDGWGFAKLALSAIANGNAARAGQPIQQDPHQNQVFIYTKSLQATLIRVSNDPDHKYSQRDVIWTGTAVEDGPNGEFLIGEQLVDSLFIDFPSDRNYVVVTYRYDDRIDTWIRN